MVVEPALAPPKVVDVGFELVPPEPPVPVVRGTVLVPPELVDVRTELEPPELVDAGRLEFVPPKFVPPKFVPPKFVDAGLELVPPKFVTWELAVVPPKLAPARVLAPATTVVLVVRTPPVETVPPVEFVPLEQALTTNRQSIAFFIIPTILHIRDNYNPYYAHWICTLQSAYLYIVPSSNWRLEKSASHLNAQAE
jgi:hypothetical protein